MDELDMVLSVIENPTRRRILEALMREPHYPLQLSKELGLSQQGIMKHLKVMEEYKMVRSYSEDSDQGGPSRKIYVPTTGFTITVDIGPGLFSTMLMTRELDHEMGRTGTDNDEEGDHDRLREVVLGTRHEVGSIDEELDLLAQRRSELIRAKERTLNEGYAKLEAEVHDYQVRRIMFEYMLRPDLGPTDIARVLGLRDDGVERILSKYLEGEDSG